MQTPRSILLHLDSSPRCATRVKLARQLSATFEAQVTAVPCTTPALMRYPYAMESAAEAVAMLQDLDNECRDKIHRSFMEARDGCPSLHWAEPLADEPWGFSRRALYADLLIMGQRDADDPAAAELPVDFLPSVLVESGKPALLLPYIGDYETVGRRVLVAWKETRESARALAASLPWLLLADRVDVVCYGDEASASLRSLGGYLEAQGIKPHLHDGGRQEGDAANRLLSDAADRGADLLVMGCYGHTRTREWVLGGVTRSILQTMTLPVLMSH